jgi:hypothetical protein
MARTWFQSIMGAFRSLWNLSHDQDAADRHRAERRRGMHRSEIVPYWLRSLAAEVVLVAIAGLVVYGAVLLFRAVDG